MMRTANCKPLCRSLIPAWAWRRGIQAFFTPSPYPAPFYSVSAFLLGRVILQQAFDIQTSDFPFKVTISFFSPHRTFFVKPLFSAEINGTSVSELTYTGIHWHWSLTSQATSLNNLTCLKKLRICFIKRYIPWQRSSLVAVRQRPPQIILRDKHPVTLTKIRSIVRARWQTL
jgi:hypothetical protein